MNHRPQNHRIVWDERDFKEHLVSTFMHRTFFTTLSFSKDHPAWPWTRPVMKHPQLNWVIWYWGLPHHRCMTLLHLALLKVTKLTWVNSSGLSRCLWMSFLPSIISSALLNLVSSANLMMVHSIPLSSPLIKILNNICPNIDPWGTPLVAGVKQLTLLSGCLLIAHSRMLHK